MQPPPNSADLPEPKRLIFPPGASAIVPVGRVPFDRHPAAVYLARLAPGSRRTMCQALEVIADALSSGRCNLDTMPWPTLRYSHAQAIRALLAEKYAPKTAAKVLSAFRGVLRECWRLGYIDAETYQRTVDVEAVRGETLVAGRALADGELRALFDVCAEEEGPLGPRDAALLAILFGCGVRRGEAVALDLGDFDVETGAITIRHGKGNKARIVYAAGSSCEAIRDWLAIRGIETGPLLHPVAKGGRIRRCRLTSQAILWRVQHLAVRAGVAHFSPHDARRTFISTLIDSGADLVTVQHLAGHANVQTTARYDRRGEEAKKKAAGLVHIPYRRRP